MSSSAAGCQSSSVSEYDEGSTNTAIDDEDPSQDTTTEVLQVQKSNSNSLYLYV